jgi:hypothetical protein
MQTLELAQHLAKLMEQTQAQHVALMCAEAVSWRCHQSPMHW